MQGAAVAVPILPEMRSHIVLTLARGFAMGAADLVPGVSGGTVALVLGIYERLIASIRAGSSAAGNLLRLDVHGFRTWMGRVEWTFVVPLAAGILLAVLALARVIQALLHDHAALMASIFMGLVAGSVVVAWRLIREPRMRHAAIILLVGIVVFLLLGLRGSTSADAAAALDPPLWVYLGAGAVAICAMILPGISGSFLLVLMGLYGTLLADVTSGDILPLVVFVLGAAIGLALFSQLLHFALKRQHDVVLALLIGLMAGSTRVLWPWPGGVESTELGAPEGDVLVVLAAAAISFVAVVVVASAAQRLEATTPVRAEPAQAASDLAPHRHPG
jgi:putative membrane protein